MTDIPTTARGEQLMVLLNRAEHALRNVSATPRLDAEILLSHVLDRGRAWLYGHASELLEGRAHAAFRQAIARRADGEPLAHITGAREFWSLPLEISRDTLVPRPETEVLVETVLDLVPPQAPVRILDLGTGCGAVALALALERPAARVVASDVSSAAIAVARRNAQRLGVQSVRFVISDWFGELAGEVFDVIASNPPYVPDADPHLTTGDCRFEPALALAGGTDGLDAFRRIIAGAGACLARGGSLMLEHGYDQREALDTLLHEAGFRDVRGREDLAGIPRVAAGRWRAGA